VNFYRSSTVVQGWKMSTDEYGSTGVHCYLSSSWVQDYRSSRGEQE